MRGQNARRCLAHADWSLYALHLADKGQLATFHEDYRRRAAAGWITDCRDSPLDSADFEDAYIGRRAAEWIANVPDDFPWHYFVSFVGPHDPFDPPTEYGDRYRDAAMPPAISDSRAGKPEWIKKRAADFTPDQIAQTRRQYCAATELIDDQIGPDPRRARKTRSTRQHLYHLLF